MTTIRSIYRTKASVAAAGALVLLGGLALVGRIDSAETAYCPADGIKAAAMTAASDIFIRPGSVEDVLAWTGSDPMNAAAASARGRPGLWPIAVSLPPDLDAADSIEQRKQAFVGVVLPLALRANQAIRADRAFVEQVVACNDADRPLSPEARARLDNLAAAYGAKGDLATLRNRIDVVPPSLLIAQAAIESGWGTSRFAQQGNALFGQRTLFAERGMQPQGLSDDAEVHVAAFPHLLASVRSYIHNLNTQPAYRAFRRQRAALRDEGRRPDGLDLASTLTAYSERGTAYVRDLKAIIRGNRLEAFDTTAPATTETGSDA